MTFCALTKSDVRLLTELYQGNFPDGWSEKMLIDAFDGGRFIAIGALDNEKLIGAITCSISFEDADIEGVVTDKEYRRRGVAYSLITKAEQVLKEKGVTKILLEVRQSNAPAISTYQKAGFNKLSVRKKYYGDGEDAVVMIKEIFGK